MFPKPFVSLSIMRDRVDNVYLVNKDTKGVVRISCAP